MRRRPRFGLILASAAALLVACGGNSGGGGTTSNGSPIKVGYLVPLTGNFGPNGKMEQQGFELGLKDFGSSVNGHPIQVSYPDTQADPNIALSAAHQLVEVQGIQMLEGPLAANEIGPVSTYIATQKVPTDDLAVCSAQQLTTYARGYGMSSGWVCNQTAIMAAKYAYEKKGWRKIVTIGQDFAFGWEVVGGFADEFKAEGGTIVKMLWAPNTTTDFAPYVSQIPTTGVDAVYAELSGNTAVRFTAAYNQFGLKAKLPLLGITQLTDYSALPAEDPAAITGVLIGAQYCDGIDTTVNKKFTTEYKAQYGVYPGYYSDAAYAKARLLVTALKKLNGDASNPQKLAQALKSSAITAARGPVKLSGAPTYAPIQNVYICQVQSVNGELRNVPIYTYPNVQPWGALSQSTWQTSFITHSSNRPTP